MNSEIIFITNNVKGIQNSVKRIKLFEYINIMSIKIFDYIFLYSAYADDTTFFLIIEVTNAFDKFSFLSGLKPNTTKYEIADIDVLKGISLALCGMDCIELTKKQ